MYYREKYIPNYDDGGSLDSFDIELEEILEPGDEGYKEPNRTPVVLDPLDLNIEDLEPPF